MTVQFDQRATESGWRRPWEGDADLRRWWALAVLCLCVVVIILDNTILNVALPSIVESIHASTSQLQWMIDAYTLVFAALLLMAGTLGDRYGRRGALMTGLTIFGLGSIAAAFATGPWWSSASAGSWDSAPRSSSRRRCR